MSARLDSVNLTSNRASVNYAMAREAINLDVKEIEKYNKARALNFAKMAKERVIHHLGGKFIEGKKGPYIEFQDGSKAKY